MQAVHVKIDEDRCKGCYICVSVCPKKVLSAGSGSLNRSGYYAAEADAGQECVGCLSCALMCPDGAISLYKDEG